jgi:Trypsin-co-occurring domain 1
MTRVLTFETSGGPLEVAVDDGLPKDVIAKDIGLSLIRFPEMFEDLRVFIDAIAKKLSEVASKPAEVEISMDVAVKAEGSLIFFKSGADAGMKVKFTWRNPSTPVA